MTTTSTTFKITKSITYSTVEEAVFKAARLEHLKKHGLGDKILIPYFEYELDRNRLTYISDYIKGVHLDIHHMPLLRRELVDRKSDWTCIDYAHTNFIRKYKEPSVFECKYEKGIYLVDLSCYGKYSKKDRYREWNKKMNNRNWKVHLI